MRNRLLLWIFVLLFAVLMSIPWLIPHTGFVALFAFVPLLVADAVADELRVKHFFPCYFGAFLLWNAITTFWVCFATVGGGIFAVLVNSLLMSAVWALFRFSKKRLSGILPYLFLAASWIAWEKLYFNVDISWPWLTLGNAFATSTDLVQWYEYTGTLGGSLWVWAVNLLLFFFLRAILGGEWRRWNGAGKFSFILLFLAIAVAPVAYSEYVYSHYEEKSRKSLDVVIAQPNFDINEKFGSYSQAEQTRIIEDMFDSAVGTDSSTFSRPVLLLGPETFCSDINLDSVSDSPTVASFTSFLGKHPNAQILFGASTYRLFHTRSAPSILAKQYGDVWVENHNSALLLKPSGEYDLFHKSKLVVGTELTPYPKLFIPLDDWLSKKFGVNGMIGRCIPQKEISLMKFNDDFLLGSAICYESVYGEYSTGFVKKGAGALTVITNDAWWGDTPGYRQHFSYSRLRAIELRRDIARCGNTGISAFINQRGDVVSESVWRERQTLCGKLNFNNEITFFVRHGDMTGRICTLSFLLLLLLTVVCSFTQKRVG